MPQPILYSLQHCPYAMRARIALLLAEQTVLIRVIEMKNKPLEMLQASPKGTVPVLLLDKLTIIDESLDIMIWALNQNDPDNLLFHDQADTFATMQTLINNNDNVFIVWLENYKYAKRYHENSEIYYRHQCEMFILQLEQNLSRHNFFMGENPCLADYAILPFIRQFARVDRKWFKQAPYPNLHTWLKKHLQSSLFSKAMIKYPLWLDKHEDCIFGG